MDLKANTHFNIIAQAYPRIAGQIELFWGHEGFDVVVGKLLKDSRDGARQGFPPVVADAIMKLMTDHSTAFPHTVKNDTDVWTMLHQR
jgi:hypothetical protein